MVENFAKWPSERGQTAKVRSSEGCEGMEFPWQWISGTIFTNLDVIWGMSGQIYGTQRICSCSGRQQYDNISRGLQCW